MEAAKVKVSEKLALTSRRTIAVLKNCAINTPFVIFVIISEWVSYPIHVINLILKMDKILFTTTKKIVMACPIESAI